MKRTVIYLTISILAVYVLFFLPLKTIRDESTSENGNYKGEITLRKYNLRPDQICIRVHELSGNKWNTIYKENKKPHAPKASSVGIEWVDQGNTALFYSISSTDLEQYAEHLFRHEKIIPEH